MNKFKINIARFFTGLMMVVMVAVPSAHALTSSDVELLIAMGVIPADKAAAARAAVSGNSSSSCAVFNRDLRIGSTGSDVVSLQTYLESKGFLTMPAGVSKGYFGGLTQSALARYQASVGISPAAGYFGPITRSDVSAKCGVKPNPNPNPNPNDDDLDGGEASLEAFDFASGDDSDIEEDQSGDVAEIEFDVEDGDIRIDRVDLAFENADENDTTDVWDALEMVELVIDGKVVGEADLSDEDEYLDEDDGTVRISGIDYKIDEGDTAKIIVRVTAQNNVDTDDQDTFTVYVLDDGIRATDAEGIQQYVGDDSDTVDFDIEEAGSDEELNVSTSSEDPDSTTFKVEEGSKSDTHAIFAFDLEAEDNDIEIDTVEVVLETSVATANLISDLILEIDGEEFDDWEYVSGTSTSQTRTVRFDIDGDYTLDADGEVTVVLWAEFNAANGSNYSSGATIEASIEDMAIEGEGADDVVSDGTATGEEHTVATEGIVIPKSGFSDEGSTSNNDANTSRDYRFEFEVTAFEEDFYVATSSVEVFVEGAGSASATYTVDSTADEDTDGVFTIREGETETFTVIVTVSNVTTSGQYRVGLDSVDYTTNSNGVSDTETKDVVNSDFRTAYRTINN
jgi:peptidoglycan hydrolase-like protein with peptidoglycan-binding domain